MKTDEENPSSQLKYLKCRSEITSIQPGTIAFQNLKKPVYISLKESQENYLERAQGAHSRHLLAKTDYT